MIVKILTCVTNGGGIGPGHSAVCVSSDSHTFQDAGGGWLQDGSGWLTFGYEAYLAENKHRPVLLQTIPTAVGSYVNDYVAKSKADDDDYLGSGVCSQQVASAINYALPKDVIFDPKGFDTPFAVYHCAQRLSLVSTEEYLWPDRYSIGEGTRKRIEETLKVEYPWTKGTLC